MTITERLQNITRLFLDTAPVIYYLTLRSPSQFNFWDTDYTDLHRKRLVPRPLVSS